MSERELAGVIACVQEIEQACLALREREELVWHHAVPELQERVLRFFGAPSADRAREVELFLRNLNAGYRRDLGAETILNAPLEVDRIRTTLSNLHEELCEVLEDIE